MENLVFGMVIGSGESQPLVLPCPILPTRSTIMTNTTPQTEDNIVYVVVAIGCVECHNPSKLIGIYSSEIEAKKAKTDFLAKSDHNREIYQEDGHVSIFPYEQL